jgi:hypothetical protein
MPFTTNKPAPSRRHRLRTLGPGITFIPEAAELSNATAPLQAALPEPVSLDAMAKIADCRADLRDLFPTGHRWNALSNTPRQSFVQESI